MNENDCECTGELSALSLPSYFALTAHFGDLIVRRKNTRLFEIGNDYVLVLKALNMENA